MDEIFDFVKSHKVFCGMLVFFVFVGAVFVFYLQEVTAEEAFTCPTSEITKTEVQVEEYAVDIKGAVVNPGVYRVKKGAIVDDIILLAGGLLENADTSNLNLSKQVTNEMVITVFTVEEIAEMQLEKEAILETTETDFEEDTLININTATLEELMTLPGIGESKARLIMEYRETCGNFNAKEELKNIKGIGESVYAQLEAYITV